LIFALVFVIQGVHNTARAIGSINFLLELAPPIERAIYVGAANGAVGLAVFLSPLGGAIVDWLGFESLFLFSLAWSLIAVVLSLSLEEPRNEPGMANVSPMI
jgi:MFS family permease